jgi:2-dehydropantoate 2-reductase
MEIAVMGAGGVGGYFGARLMAAGEAVSFIARGAHLAAMRRHGLSILSAKGDVHLDPVTATDDPAEIGPVDVVIFTVKLWDTEAAARACAPLLGPGTAVISFQNGVESEAILAARLGAAQVMAGVAQIGAVIAEPGTIRHTGTMARLVFGEPDGSASARARAFLAACEKAGIDAVLSPDIATAIWEKFVFLAPLAGVTSVTRLPVGAIAADPDTRALFRDAVAEAVAVARARGIGLDAGAVDRVIALVDGLPHEMQTSMQQDLERGTRLELPWLNGAIVRLGAEAGVATPVNRTLYAALKPYADGRPQA